jgi:asparagine N-glycosylation enzyme membrane subunit Stt3
MFSYTQRNLQPTDVVAAWWDYGYWLGILGNVTTLADNATVNATQIENVGFIMMANETNSLRMLAMYDAKYILVFTTLEIEQTSQQAYVAHQFSGRRYQAAGDEGKWTWMAKISGQARQRLIDKGFIDEQSAWSDETKFGGVDNQTNQWVWNDVGKNSVIYKLMSWAKQRWTDNYVGYITADESGVQPEYFKEAYFAGLEDGPFQYGGIYVPLVALYEIDWQKYYNATSTTG